MQVVWFKRDLRLDDHWPLVNAVASGPTLCLYVYEPEIIGSDEFDSSHLQFINQSLSQLDHKLRALNSRLTYRFGSMPDVLSALHATHPITALWSHQETGNRVTYDRDLRVSNWTRDRQIPWREIPQNGVVRRLKSRDGWAKQRTRFLKQPLAEMPSEITHPSEVPAGSNQPPEALGLTATSKTKLQAGGETHALETLKSFLTDRGQDYSTEMSSPVTAVDACSRLSTYLAWGCISIRRVVRELQDRQGQLRELRDTGEPVGGWLKSLRAFESRLSWHCHFMQKFEDEPELEFSNMSPVYDGLRENEFNQRHFDSWCTAQTGYPMVDACMRALHQHSWINFRMRAMLVSFASYHLWLHWRPTAVYLARHFLDFEPGIHYSQFQMQSGTTGINAIRIYSPIKQVKDQDPTGKFIRHFVPELAAVPERNLAEPHKMSLAEQSKSGCQIGKDYPHPIVEHAAAYKVAKDRMFAVRKHASAREDADRVFRKHGSRKRSNSVRKFRSSET